MLWKANVLPFPVEAPPGPYGPQLAGASTDHAREFYQALLDQKSPRRLAYYYALSNLDQRHQAFFTANFERTKRFYALFTTLPESQTLTGGAVADTSFSKLLRSVPIDDEGNVAFPGSPDLWRFAKGNSFDEKDVAGAREKTSRAAPPEVEDEILLRLLATHYKSHSVTSRELDVFLAVAGIDAHRTKPLDEESAALLAQHYGEFSPAYPYFTDLSAIDAPGFRSFFGLVDGIARQSLLERQLELGQLNSLIEWVVLARRRGAIDDAEAAGLFARICALLAEANDGAARTQASIDLAQAILTDCGHGAVGEWDDTLRACLLGASADKGDQRGKDYEIVLDEQKAPSIDVVRSIVAEAEAALTPAGSPHPAVIAQDRAALPAVPLPGEAKVIGKEKDAILPDEPRPFKS